VPFSKPHAIAARNFFERVLKHTADEWYGKPFILAPWQEQALEAIFGNLDDSGNRTIEMAYLEVPKKSGKTEFAAGIVLLVLITSQARGAQVYGAAAATRQAMNVYRAACAMVDQSPILKSQLRLLRGTNRILKRSDPNSFYAAVAADGDMSDGVNPICTIADEVHRWKTRKQLENWDVLSNGGITRKQTLTIAITTAGIESESPLAWRLHEKTRKLEQGVVSDPRFYGKIYGAGKEDNPADPETWIRANPSLKQNGGFLDIEKIEQQYVKHAAEGDLTSFKRFFLNLWDQKETRAIDLVQWDACQKPWISAGLLPKPPEDLVRPIASRLQERFFDRQCWVGIDLSMSTDLSSVSFVFPCDDGGYDVLPFFWTPEDGVRKRQLRDGMPYRQWADEGYIELCPGAVIDYRDIRARLEWGSRVFNLEEFCFDPWNSREMSVPMIDDGYKCVEVRQGFQSLSEPSKKLLELVASGKLYHGGHPVLRWNASCLNARWYNDNLMFTKPDREKSSSRIDGISATVNAMHRALVAESNTISYTGLRSVG
jgi:phage terminase large subunit-like protein